MQKRCQRTLELKSSRWLVSDTREGSKNSNASYVWWVLDTREGLKNSKVRECTFWVVGISVFEAMSLKTSVGKSQTGVVVMVR